VKARLVLVAAVALMLVATASGSAAPGATPSCLSRGDGFRLVSFAAADGVRLYGITSGAGSLGLVLGHQVQSDSCEWYDMAKVFVARGYRVLAIDFRGFGLSPAATHGNPTGFAADIGGGAAELRRLGARRVIAIGSSMGGTAVVVAGATHAYHLAGVVSLSGAGLFWGINAIQAARHLTIPVRFLAARQDLPFADAARAMAKQAPSKDKALLILPGDTHGTSLLEDPGTATRARAFVFAFLRQIAERR
jgi:pimeloyl-ACP methyl ester carboxylesterase